MDCKEIKPVNPKGNQYWLTGKDLDAGKDWRQEEKGTTEDEMIGRHYRLDGREFEQAPGVGDGQRGLACCSPWVCKELDRTEWLSLLNWYMDVGGRPDVSRATFHLPLGSRWQHSQEQDLHRCIWSTSKGRCELALCWLKGSSQQLGQLVQGLEKGKWKVGDK